MEQEYILGQKVENMKETITATKNMVLVFSPSRMEAGTREDG